MSDNSIETGKQLAELADNDILRGFLGLVSAGLDNPAFAIAIGLMLLCGYTVYKVSKPNNSVADVAKESTATTEKITLRQSDMLSSVIEKLTGISEKAIDVQDKTNLIHSEIVKRLDAHGALIEENTRSINKIKCIQDNR
jgi:hypothetical protein